MLAATVSTSTPGACNQDPLPEATCPYRHGWKKKNCNDSVKNTVSSDFQLNQPTRCSIFSSLLLV